jgi:hypothetical protein
MDHKQFGRMSRTVETVSIFVQFVISSEQFISSADTDNSVFVLAFSVVPVLSRFFFFFFLDPSSGDN